MSGLPADPADPSTPSDEGEKRGPGRPVDLAKRQAVVDATLELLAEVGYGALTIDAVAQRAGSNRVLVYRVWDSKVGLVRDALFGTAADLVVPDRGSLLDDLRDYLAQHVDNMARPAYVKGVPGLTVELQSDPELYRDTFRRYIAPSEDGYRAIFEKAVERGELDEAPDARVVVFVVGGIITGLAQSTRLSHPAITDVLLDTLLGGVLHAARGAHDPN